MPRCLRRSLLAVTTALSLGAATSQLAPAESARALSIAVHVDEAAGVVRKNAPCLAAVPLPRDLAITGTGSDLTLTTEAGVPVPCQVRVQSRWDAKPGDVEKPIRWVLLAFECDLGSHRTKSFRLVKRTNDFKPEKPVTVTSRDAGHALLDTGALKVKLGGPSLIESIGRPGGELLAKRIHAFVREGEEENALAEPPTVEVLESGPVRGVVRLTGKLSRTLGYALTVEGWAGRPELKLSLETRNSDPKTNRTVRLTELGLAVELPATASGVVSPEGERGITDHDAFVLEQLAPPAKGKEAHFELGVEGGARVGEGKEHEGWLVAKTSKGAVGVATRKPVGRAPSGLRLAKDRFTIRFVTPPREGAEGPLRNRWLADCQHRTDEALVFFGSTNPAEASALVAGFRSRLQGAPNASWVRDAGGLMGPIADEADERAAYGAVGLELAAKEEKKGALAKPQFEIGDLNVKWDTESDEARDWFVHWLRTAERGSFDEAVAWAEFYRDRYPPRTDGFTFEDSEKRPRATEGSTAVPGDKGDIVKTAQTLECYRWKESHLYGEGLVAHWLLTGDLASLEAAKDLGEMVEKRFAGVGPTYGITEVRVFARPLQLVAALAEATGEERWRELAGRFAAAAFSGPTRDPQKGCYAIKMFVGDLDLDSVLAPGVSLPERFPKDAAKGLFQKGPRRLWIKGERASWPYQDRELGHALARVFEATGDERARQALIGLADYYVDEGLVPCWHQPEIEITPYCTLPYVPEPEVARYLQPSTPLYSTNLGLIEAAAYLVSGDERFLDVAKKCLKIAATRGYRDHRPFTAEDRKVKIPTRIQWGHGWDDQRTFVALGAGPRRVEAPGAPTDLSVRRGPRAGTIELSFTPPDDRAARWLVQGASRPIAARHPEGDGVASFAAEPLAMEAARRAGANGATRVVLVVVARAGLEHFIVCGEDARGLLGPPSNSASRAD